MFDVKITNFPPTAERIMKYIKNGTAVGLTRTAKEAQAAVQGAAKGAFTNRKQWFLQQSPIGIRIKAASGDQPTPTAEVKTAAYFLPLQDAGGIKFPYKNYLAIPADEGPLANKKSIPENLRPKNLKNTFPGKVFELVTKKGTRLLCVRGFTSVTQFNEILVPMYVLITQAKITATHVFHDPIKKVCDRRLVKNLDIAISEALARLAGRS